MFAGMFVVGTGLFRSGLAAIIGRGIVSLFGNKCPSLVAAVMLAGGVLSASLSNIGTTAVLIPVVRGIGISAGLGHRRLLLPLAYSATLGGMLTLIGTPLNLVVQAALIDSGLRPFGFFEFGLLGLPLLAIGTLYMVLAGRHMIKAVGPGDQPQSNQNSQIKDPNISTGSRKSKWISGLVLLGVVTTIAGGWIPISIAALTGALLLVIFGSLSLDEAVRSVEWTAIFLFAGMLALSDALVKTGADQLIVNAFIRLLGPSPSAPLVIGGIAFESAVESRRCVVGESPIQGRISDSP